MENLSALLGGDFSKLSEALDSIKLLIELLPPCEIKVVNRVIEGENKEYIAIMFERPKPKEAKP